MKDQPLIQFILGDIAANENYGLVMKKWRELFNITQSRIAKELGIKQSVISDYENNRRKSPGIEFLRKYTNSLVIIANKEQRKEYEAVIESVGVSREVERLFKGSLDKRLTQQQVIKLFNSTQIIAPVQQSKFKQYIFFADNISRLATKQPSLKLLKGLKSNDETVYIFSKVKSGKIPLIMLKLLTKINRLELPKLIIFQSERFKLSPLARKIAKNNNISIAVTKESNNRIKELLNINLNNVLNN